MGYKPQALKELDRDYIRWVKRRLDTGALIGWIAEDQFGNSIGGGVLWLRPRARPPPNSRTVPYLTSMYTEPAFRGKGVGSTIIREAIKWSRTHGFTSIVIHSGEGATGFYPRFGFKRTWEMECDLV